MQLTTAISENAPKEIFEAFRSTEFAKAFLEEIVGNVFAVRAATSRPAEYSVHKPDVIIPASDASDKYGVEILLSGVSRRKRKSETFKRALIELDDLCHKTLKNAIIAVKEKIYVQFHTSIKIDDEIEYEGNYTSLIEREPTWIHNQYS